MGINRAPDICLNHDGRPYHTSSTFWSSRLIHALKDIADSIKEIHETIGTTGYYLEGAHALAALYHHYVKRDNTLIRMLP